VDEMLKAYLLQEYEWLRPEEVTEALFDSVLNEIDYKQCGKTDYACVDDVTELLEFAIEWGKKHG